MSADNCIALLKSPMDCWFGFEYRVCHCMGIDNIYFDEEKEEFDNDKINKKILHEYFDNVEPVYDRTEAYKKSIELLRDLAVCEYGIISVDLQEPYEVIDGKRNSTQ